MILMIESLAKFKIPNDLKFFIENLNKIVV